MRTISFLFLAAFATTAAHAAASSDDNAVSITTDLRGYQLADEAGVSRLNRHVSQLARRVCAKPGIRGAQEHADFVQCRKTALSDAQRQVQKVLAAARSRDETRLAAK